MAGFDFFTMPTIVRPPINLFGDAAEQGARIGTAVPKQSTAAIQGVIKGFKEGQQMISNQQKIGLQNEALKQAPIQTDIMTSQAETASAQAEIAKSKANITVLNEQQQQETELAQLKLQEQIALGTSKIGRYLSGDAATQRQILTDPDVQIALQDPNVARATYGKLAANGTLTEEEREKYASTVNYLGTLELERRKYEFEEKQKAKVGDTLDKIQEKIDTEAGGVKAIMNGNSEREGVSWEQLADGKTVQVYPQGLKTTKDDGTIDTSVPDNDLYNETVGKPAKPISSYDVFVNGKRWNTPISQQEYKLLQQHTTAYRAKFGMPAAPSQQQELKAPESLISDGSTGTSSFWERAGSAIREGVKKAGSVFYEEPEGFTPTVEGSTAQTPVGTTVTGPTRSVDESLKRGIVLPSGRIASTGNPVKDAARRELAVRAESDPDIRNRLVAKGVLKSTEAAPTQQGGMVPTGAVRPALGMTMAPQFINQAASAIKEGVKRMFTPKEVVISAYEALPAPAKKYVEKEVLEKVHSEPLLKNASPLQRAVAAVESGGKRDAKSPTGPKGLFQLSKGAAKDMKVDRDVPEQNVTGGIRYLDKMMNRYFGNEEAALMAYNTGPGVVDSIIDLTGSSDYEDLVFGLKYLHEKKMYPKLLTKSKVEEASKYPLKVLAYKEAFEAMTRG